MQLINVAAGGTLYQDIAEQLPGSIKHDYFPFGGQSFARDYLAHEVDVAGTRLAAVFGVGALRVNSMHHQGVRDLGDGLVATPWRRTAWLRGSRATMASMSSACSGTRRRSPNGVRGWC